MKDKIIVNERGFVTPTPEFQDMMVDVVDEVYDILTNSSEIFDVSIDQSGTGIMTANTFNVSTKRGMVTFTFLDEQFIYDDNLGQDDIVDQIVNHISSTLGIPLGIYAVTCSTFPADDNKKSFKYKGHTIRWQDKYEDGTPAWYVYNREGEEDWSTDTKAEAKQWIDSIQSATNTSGIPAAPRIEGSNYPDGFDGVFPGDDDPETQYEDDETDTLLVPFQLLVKVDALGDLEDDDRYGAFAANPDTRDGSWSTEVGPFGTTVELRDQSGVAEDIFETLFYRHSESIPLEGIYTLKGTAKLVYNIDGIGYYHDRYDGYTEYLDDLSIRFQVEYSEIQNIEFEPFNIPGN